ncbi:MAG: sugar ABC transporter substrate-binding protein [Paenibacillaceae bacterium]|jgi:putative aldouronate transport system substrate-binding protein|nr:MAG: sugar ABC transporter substrate-binding protein [Paenibacillaceae bacterium]
MLRKKKRLVLLVMLAAMLALAACGGSGGGGSDSKGGANSGNGGSSSGGGDQAAEIDASKLPPYEVILMYPGSPQPDEKLVEEAMNKILKEKINATIDIQPIDWGAWNDKMNLMFASGEKADLVFTASWNGHVDNVTKGAFVELDGLLEKYGQGILESIDPFLLEGARVKGKLYAVPTNKEIAASWGVLVRKDLADKYNMDFSNVKTLADLEPFLQIIKENEPDVTPLFQSSTQTLVGYVNGYDNFGDPGVPGSVKFGSTDPTLKYLIEEPEYLENLRLLRSWYLKGYINEDAPTSTLQANETARTGRVFMWPESLKPGKDKEMESTIGFPLTQIEIVPPYITTADTTNSMIGISRTSKDPERAMMVLNLLHTDKELLNLLDWGIEGVHYVKVPGNDNMIKLPDGVDPSKRAYNHGSQWMFGNQFLSYLWENEAPDKWEQFRKFNESAEPSLSLGFTFDPSNVKAELAVLNNIRDEFTAALETGSVDPDEVLPKYIEKAKEAGAYKVLQEKQRQLDEFLAAKK